MKINSFIKSINFFLFIKIFFNYFCTNREIDSTEEILSNLIIRLNKAFIPNKILSVNKNYFFNITYVQPVIFFNDYICTDDSIIIIKPKLILYMNSKLFIPLNSKVNYCNDNSDSNFLSTNIVMNLNFTNITFERLQDNSYSMKSNFQNDNFTENSEIMFNYVENYNFFQKNKMGLEEKKAFYELFLNNITEYLDVYPECDGLYFFKRIYEYIITIKKFNNHLVSYSIYLDNPEVTRLTYEKHVKAEKIKSKILNIKIGLQYAFCSEGSVVGFCPTVSKICTIKDIIIYNNNIESINLEIVKGICDFEDDSLIREIFKTAQNAIIP